MGCNRFVSMSNFLLITQGKTQSRRILESGLLCSSHGFFFIIIQNHPPNHPTEQLSMLTANQGKSQGCVFLTGHIHCVLLQKVLPLYHKTWLQQNPGVWLTTCLGLKHMSITLLCLQSSDFSYLGLRRERKVTYTTAFDSGYS